MADKKPIKKPAPDHGSGGSGDSILWIVVILVVVSFGVFGLGPLFSTESLASNSGGFISKISSVVVPIINGILNPHTWYVVGIISSIFSIFFIAVIIFCLVRMREIQNIEKGHIEHEVALALARDAELSKNENPRWQYVLSLVESQSESDWRIAIIEADSILDDLMNEKGYTGPSLGERLTNARGDAFMSLDNAWEAHSIRNRIAHDGADFPLSQLEARRVIRLYESVFEEFGIV